MSELINATPFLPLFLFFIQVLVIFFIGRKTTSLFFSNFEI
ncbi:MAG: hypothetical protein QHH09_02655 [Microgenomates group bacterium]|nr:hypothetical protein [Microgenomates group bacterium]